LVLRNDNTGQFKVYNIADNQITGFRAVGYGWHGVAAWWLRGQFSDRLHGQLRWLNLSARAGNGRFRWRQWDR